MSSLSNLLTPVKEKADKSRNNVSSSSASQANGQSGSDSLEKLSDVAPTGKRALPARGAKKPSIEDMITFLCYRGTAALPPHLAHLNQAPSPEPASTVQKGSSETSRSKQNDKTHKDSDKVSRSGMNSHLKKIKYIYVCVFSYFYSAHVYLEGLFN